MNKLKLFLSVFVAYLFMMGIYSCTMESASQNVELYSEQEIQISEIDSFVHLSFSIACTMIDDPNFLQIQEI